MVRLEGPLHRLLDRGVPVIGLEPSCLLTLRDEWPALLPGTDTGTVAERAVLFEEFLAAEAAAGRIQGRADETSYPYRLRLSGNLDAGASTRLDGSMTYRSGGSILSTVASDREDLSAHLGVSVVPFAAASLRLGASMTRSRFARLAQQSYRLEGTFSYRLPFGHRLRLRSTTFHYRTQFDDAAATTRTGWRAFAHRRRTLPGVSSPASVVRSMHVTARSSQAACHAFLTERRAPSVAARRRVALGLTCEAATQSRSSGVPLLRSRCAADSVTSSAMRRLFWCWNVQQLPTPHRPTCSRRDAAERVKSTVSKARARRRRPSGRPEPVQRQR